MLPTPIVEVAGAMVIDARAAGVTVSDEFAENAPTLARIFVTPVVIVVANPVGPTDAAAKLEDDQIACAETSCVEPFV